MADVDVTVLIATRNRADHIGKCLTTVLEATRQTPFSLEVLVVNNGSSDHTDSVLQDFAAEWPILRIVDDPVPGRSGVLNRTLGVVKGRVVVFTDDDVHVPPSWIVDMATPILEGRADTVCGRVELAPHLDRPWLTPELRTQLAEMPDVSGDTPGMVGANMAASREAALAIGFDEELGPGGRGFADDVLFNLRLKTAGYRLVGCTGPPVVHHLSADRLNYAAMKDLAQRNGSSHAYLWHHWLHSDLRLLGLRQFRARAQLAWTGLVAPSDGEAISEREYHLWFAHSFCAHLAEERSRPRTYATADRTATTASR
jgi:glycosyltransferase involved in cell wall biosynthesis